MTERPSPPQTARVSDEGSDIVLTQRQPWVLPVVPATGACRASPPDGMISGASWGSPTEHAGAMLSSNVSGV